MIPPPQTNEGDEPTHPVRLGAGSFGSVWVHRGGPYAFKIVHSSSNASVILHEYRALIQIYERCKFNLFRVPTPRAFYDPATPTYLEYTPPVNPASSRHRRDIVTGSPANITSNPFAPLEERACYAMDRVHALPPDFARHIRAQCYPVTARDTGKLPVLCRLYFGRLQETLAQASRFFNSTNFTLDSDQYRQLAQSESRPSIYMPTVDEVAEGMGEALAQIHWRAGFDARDVEFVMGGDGFSELTFYVIDFNQVRRLRVFEEMSANALEEDISMLVEAHYLNDPYYPRARPTDPLYIAFKARYLAASRSIASEGGGPKIENSGTRFLEELELEQGRRDVAHVLTSDRQS